MANRQNHIFPECYVDTNILKTLLRLDAYDYCDFRELCRSGHLVLMKHQSKHHYLIFVCKAAEDLLLTSAAELQLDMDEYDLPSSLEGLKEITKNAESDHEPRIRK